MILYHNTTNNNAIKISKQGLKCDKGEEYRSGFKEYEGNLIWATNNPIKGYGNCTISFEISDEEASKYKVNDTQYAIPRDISPSEEKRTVSEREQLKNKLEKLVKEENYEEAALVRDKIKALSKSSDNNSDQNLDK